MTPMTRPALALLLAGGLVACGPSPDAASGAAGGPGGPALPDTAMVREVAPSTTAELVAGDLRSVSPSVAIQTLDLWVARLDTSSVEGTAGVRDDLERLRNLLQSSPLDGAAIGRAMREAGEGTAALADSAGSGGLAGLARALRVAGSRLAPDTSGAPRREAE